MQCRQIVDKTWGIKPSMMKWIYTAIMRLIMSYACVSWAGGLNKKYLVRKLIKMRRLACLMISLPFPGTPTGALEILLNPEVGVAQNSSQVSQVAQLRNLRCALCLFFRSCAICVALYACFFSACAICVALYAFFFSACAICVCESVNLIFVAL